MPFVDGVDLAAVARNYSAAVSRVLAAPRWKMLAADVLGVLSLFYVAYEVVFRNLSTVASTSASSAITVAVGLYLATVVACGGFFYVMGAVVRVAPDAVDLTAPKRDPRYLTAQVTTLSLDRRGYHGLAVTAIWLSVVLVACVAVANPGLDVVLGAARQSSLLVAGAAVAVVWEWGQLVGGGLALRRGGVDRPRPLDLVATQLVVVAARVWSFADSPKTVDQGGVRAQVDALERAARDAERFALPRAPRWDRNAHRAAHTDGLRLATVIRAHKLPLARAMSAEDFTKIARSLTGGLGAWSRGDFESMVRDAPEVTLPTRFRTVLTRLAPAVTLAILGIVLPLLPPLNATAQAASSARTSLLVGAALALVGGAVQVEGYITTTILRN